MLSVIEVRVSLNLTCEVIHIYYIYLTLHPWVGTQYRYEICCDSSTKLALQYDIAKLTVHTSMYKTKIDKPCINFCNMQLTAMHLKLTLNNTDKEVCF